MQRSYALYLQITGGLLGGLLLVIGCLWAFRSRALESKLGASTDARFQQAYTDERARLGWIGGSDGGVSLGVGVLVTDKRVMSAAHVLTGAQARAFYRPGREALPLEDVAHDDGRDLAWASVEEQDGMGDVQIASEVSDGEPVYMWLYQDGDWQRETGEVSNSSAAIQLRQTWGEVVADSVEVVSVVMENNLGDSGAPVWNENGELVGILIGVDLEDVRVSYVVRADERWLGAGR